jgi:hypothetical protein
VTITATFKTIGYDKRTVTLRRPQQRTVTLKVGKDVKRFNEVKKAMRSSSSIPKPWRSVSIRRSRHGVSEAARVLSEPR